MDQLLTDFGIDGWMKAALWRVLSNGKKRIAFDDVLEFFTVITSGNVRQFSRWLFEAMDMNRDGRVCSDDLVKFTGLLNETIDSSEASEILKNCGVPETGSLGFEDFWGWYRMEHGIQGTEEEDWEPVDGSSG
jgi:Ca2+-binding EF-hand superfamily protein